VHAVLRLEGRPNEPVCLLAVREGLCYRLHRFPASGRWPARVARILRRP
jgi:hypothetical protein